MIVDKNITEFPAEPETKEDFEGYFNALNGVLARGDIIEITHEMQTGVGQYTPIEVRTEK